MISRTAGAQAYPTRPVHMIVPLTAGSAADILARRLAQKVGESWGQTVVVENRPGAGTTLGADVVAKAAPDGHTLLMNSAAFAVSAAVYQKLPYDPLKDFAPVSQVAAAPIVVVVAPSLGVKSINRTASENTAPVPFESAYAIWTSWQHSCDRDDQALMQRGDRVGNVTLGPDRRRRGVGNYREWQVF